MKSWVQEISKKYTEQNYILFENKFDLIARILREATNIFNSPGGAGGAGGGGGGGGAGGAESKAKGSKTASPEKKAARRAKYAAIPPEEKSKLLAARRSKSAGKRASASASGGSGGSGGQGGQGGSGATVGNLTQNAADVTGNENVTITGNTGSVTINKSEDQRTFNDNRRVKYVKNIYRGGRGGRGSGQQGPNKIYRVERRLKSVIGPVTRAIGVVKGVGSGLDKMMGGADGVLSGAEQIGSTLTPSTSKQLQLYRQLGKQLTPQEMAILTGNKKP